MSTLEIERQVRYVNDARGRSMEVLMPYKVFIELVELKTSMEIYEQATTRQSIKRAKSQVANGKARSFRSAAEASRWLRK